MIHTEKDIIREVSFKLNWDYKKTQECYEKLLLVFIRYLTENKSLYFDNFGLFSMIDCKKIFPNKNWIVTTKTLRFFASPTILKVLYEEAKSVAKVIKAQRLVKKKQIIQKDCES